MFHRIGGVREKGAEVEAKPSGQARDTSDTDADDAYILSMYKK